LDEIVQLLAVPEVPPGQAADEWKVLLDQARARTEITVPVVVPEQLPDGGVA
jgi:hypothetical protein